MSGALYDQLGEALRAQRERFGADAFDNRRRVISLLADSLPEARREIRAIASALDEGAMEALSSVERRLLGMEMDRQADKLEQSVGLRPDLAKQVIRALAYALDLGPPPSVYEAAPAPSAPPPQDWAGMSQPTAAASSYHPPPSHSVSPAPVISPTHYAPQQPHAPQQPAPSSLGLEKVLFTFQGTPITRLHAAIAAGVVALGVLVLPMLGNGGGGAPAPHTLPEVQLSDAGYAGEMNDTGVQAKETLESNVGSPTPITVPGGQRVTTKQVVDMMRADANVILIDVLVDPHNVTAQGARYVPAAGQPGGFNDAAQAQTVQALRNVTGGRNDRPLVFFCAGAACWESYNAVLRARAAGYTRLYWYRGGLASWHAAGLPMQNLPPPSN
ncbi:MAG TPA: rhodanese-like domain-containing protein [Terricaulis sp.]|nr:rhodanese-like domain-containing protein [Terricaulis sp.]